MPPSYSNPYASDFTIRPDGLVTFTCSQDADTLPWLTLSPHHPVVVQTQAFWTAVGASMTLGGMEDGQWSALTWAAWELGDASGGQATHGEYRPDQTSENPSYELVLFNEASKATVTFRGRGVIFRNRNFEKWREGSKTEAHAATPTSDFIYTEHTALGLRKDERVLVAPYDLQSGYVEALVTPENGFPPGNPLIGGSGDHVNSTHFHEIARQALFLIKERNDIDTSGEMSLKRYVELGTPLRLNIRNEAKDSMTFELQQLNKTCAEITLRWQV